MLFSRKKADSSVEELVTAAQDGKTEAFGKLYDNFVDQIYRFVYFKVGSKEVSEDLTQTIFLKAFEKIRSFKKESSFASWLFAISRNSIIDHYRSRERVVEFDLEIEIPVEDNTQELETRETLETTLKALRDLDKEEAEVITLSSIEEYSFKEIAQIMNKSEGALRILKFRALKKLKKILSI